MRDLMWRVALFTGVAVVVAAALAVFQSVHAGGDAAGPNRAQVLGTYWTVAASVIGAALWAVQRWRSRITPVAIASTTEQVEAAADLLAERTLRGWSEQAAMRGITTPAPVRVHWRWAPSDLAVPREEVLRSQSLPVDPRALSGESQILGSGTLTRLHDEVYVRLKHGRLVIVGAPGAGKTGAMLLLLLTALRNRASASEYADRAPIPVPVWLTLGSWDVAKQSLRTWVTSSLRRDHPYLDAVDFGPNAVDRLFDTGRIALFLDGLDEMPDALRPVAARRVREETAGLRVVLTSRTDEYRAALGSEGIPNAAVIDLRPVSAKAAAEYLVADRNSEDARRWAPVINQMLMPLGETRQGCSSIFTTLVAGSA